jgi:two-component system cell cycle sensor histidine kinase/response regulator CckA
MRQSNDSVGTNSMKHFPLLILIVEDNCEDLTFYLRLLDRQSTFSCHVLTAATGAEGLSCVQRAEPVCILLNYLLPDMDGLQFLATRRELPTPASPAVVMLTSQSDTAVAVKAIKRGAHDYLDKGVLSQERLVHTIVNATTQVTLQRKLRDKEYALQESECHYRTLVEASIQGLCIDQDSRIQFANPAMATMFGYHRLQDLLGQPYDAVVAPHERGRLEAYRVARLHHEPVPSSYEYQGLCQDGRLIWLECVASPLQWHGRPAILSAFVDITARKQAEKELLRARKIESVGVLAGGIAHDFNNLLTGILGNLSLAKQLASPHTKIVNRLTEAEKACEQATALTQQLLTFSKGGVPIRQTVSIASVLRESVDFVLHGANVRGDLRIPDDLWAVDVDEGQIYQVIHNVVLNAIQAMPEGGIVQVAAENVVLPATFAGPIPKGRYVKIAITDQGRGIPDDILTQIFDPYFTTKPQGSGLGLAIAYAIVAKHEGYLTVASEVGVGTTFYFYLPVARQPIDPMPQATGPRLGSGRLLVVDDEAYILDLLGEMLSTMGYDVTCCDDGKDAIATYQRALLSGCAFIAVILDVTIPGGMGGCETIAHLRAIDPDVKAIISSGYANDPVMANFVHYGFSGVITKPYTLERLHEVLQQVLGS